VVWVAVEVLLRPRSLSLYSTLCSIFLGLTKLWRLSRSVARPTFFFLLRGDTFQSRGLDVTSGANLWARSSGVDVRRRAERSCGRLGSFRVVWASWGKLRRERRLGWMLKPFLDSRCTDVFLLGCFGFVCVNAWSGGMTVVGSGGCVLWGTFISCMLVAPQCGGGEGEGREGASI